MELRSNKILKVIKMLEKLKREVIASKTWKQFKIKIILMIISIKIYKCLSYTLQRVNNLIELRIKISQQCS